MTPTPAKPTHILACDPGLHGALALYTLNTRQIHVWDIPIADGQVDPRALAASIDAALFSAGIKPAEVHGAIENVSSRPRQAHAFTFGLSTGIVHGVFGTMGIDYSTVPPGQWKPAMGLRKALGETQDQNKTRARELAMKLWPELAEEFKRVKDDGRAEACLIARFVGNSIDNKLKLE